MSDAHPLQPPTAPMLRAAEPVPAWRVGERQPLLSPELSIGTAAVGLLGGPRALKQWPQSRAELHGALVQGLPGSLLLSLVDQLSAVPADALAAALGISSRTLRRLRDQPTRPLAPDLASKAWQLAELVGQAVQVFGGAQAAQQWLLQPALGLDGARPIDLLRTLQGTELVAELLGRLEHGVYN